MKSVPQAPLEDMPEGLTILTDGETIPTHQLMVRVHRCLSNRGRIPLAEEAAGRVSISARRLGTAMVFQVPIPQTERGAVHDIDRPNYRHGLAYTTAFPLLEHPQRHPLFQTFTLVSVIVHIFHCANPELYSIAH